MTYRVLFPYDSIVLSHTDEPTSALTFVVDLGLSVVSHELQQREEAVVERQVEASVQNAGHEDRQRQKQIESLAARQLGRPCVEETVTGRVVTRGTLLLQGSNLIKSPHAITVMN